MKAACLQQSLTAFNGIIGRCTHRNVIRVIPTPHAPVFIFPYIVIGKQVTIERAPSDLPQKGEAFEKACSEKGVEFFLPPPILCTDNAAMIGSAAYFEYIRGLRNGLDLNAVPNLKLGER